MIKYKVIYIGQIVYAFGITVATFDTKDEAEYFAANKVDLQVIEYNDKTTQV